MEEARDMYGISIPFVVGITAAAVILPFLIPLSAFGFAAFMLLIILGILFWIVRKGNFPFSFELLFFVVGFWCYSVSSIVGVDKDNISLINNLIGRFYSTSDCVIDNMDFSCNEVRGLVKALILGDRRELSEEIVRAFRCSGASHILALSGLHLGIVYMLVCKLLAVLGNTKCMQAVKGILICFLSGSYVLITGASPSLVRAFLFIVLNEFCRITSRNVKPISILLAALTLQLVVKPDLITSVGFQLSYLAMTGIIILFPVLKKCYPESDKKGKTFSLIRKVWEINALTISCQVFTAPVAWWHFRTFPQYFLLTNLIAMPLITLIMICTLLALILSLFGCCPAFLIFADEKLIKVLLFCLDIISQM